MGVFQNNLMGAAAAAASGSTDFYEYQIDKSLRLPLRTSGFSKTYSGSDGDDAHFTLSWWQKGRPPGHNQPMDVIMPRDGTDNSALNELYFADATASAGTGGDALCLVHASTGDKILCSTNLFRDPSAWYHFVVRADMDNATASEKLKFYVNGTEMSYATDNRSSYSSAAGFGNAGSWRLFRYHNGSYGLYSNVAEMHYIDGTSLTPSSFGETKNGVWVPKEYDTSDGAYGTLGFYLKFESSSDLGNDSSGNNNDWTTIDLSSHDQMLDSPTFDSSSNGGNYCTINPVYRGDQTSDAYYGVLSEGNLKHSYSGTSDAYCGCTHKVPASGKWYFEYLINAGGGTRDYSPAAGIMDPNEYTFADRGSDGSTGSIVYGNNTNKVYKDTSISGTYSGSRGSNGDVMGIAVDMDNGAFYVSKNGTFQTIDGGSQGDPTSGSSKTGAGATWTPASDYTSGMVPLSAPTGGSAPIITMNFGQDGTFAGQKTAGGNSDTNGYGNFFSAVPSGYSAICTGALSVEDEIDPAQTDDDYPQKLFTALAYSGDGGGSQTTGFQPDLVWVKRRDGAQSNGLWDSTRGTTKILISNETDAEGTSSGLTSFNSTGYTMGTYYNQSGNTYASWSWRANGGTTSTNTQGDINSTVQVDPSGCFSIVKYTGGLSSSGVETVGHGLSKAPSLFITKSMDKVGNWWVFSDGQTNWNYGMNLNSTGASTDKSGNGSMSAPTSTVFSTNYTDGLNESGNDLIAYVFANCEGYIKSGTYDGNGDGSDGTFVYTGFRPAWVLTKRLTTNSWRIQDNKMDTNNPTYHVLKPQSTAGQDAYTDGTDYNDFLSNGFKLARGGDAANFNADGETYIYLAMAHNPFKYATAR